MLHESPLINLQQEYLNHQAPGDRALQAAAHRPGAAVGERSQIQQEIEFLPYGVAGDDSRPTCQVVANLGPVELEYAAIRRGAAVFDSPHRGTLLVSGSPTDRRDFLNRMVTQELKNLAPGMAKSAFWLNRKGRIDADLFIIELGDRMFIDVDIHQAAATAKSLTEFLFSEDVQIKDVSSDFHHIALHGRSADNVLAAVCGLAHFNLNSSQAAKITIDHTEVAIARRDLTGETGYELIIPYSHAATVWKELLSSPAGTSPTRPIGWHAFNIARIEAGTPLFNIDFGTTNLPHETGILSERVSFTKGCYLGQEVVARMQNLGKPRQTLVGLRVQGELLPIAGAQVFARNADDSMGDEIGVITSSTLSPMLGAAPVAFAMIKTAFSELGAMVLVNAEGQQARAAVSPLQFWGSPNTNRRDETES